MYKPRNVFIHTPKEAGTAEQGEKQQKKSEFLAHQTLTGRKMKLFGGLDEVRVVRGDMGTAQGQTHPSHPSAKEFFGNLGQEFVGFFIRFPNFPFVLFPDHSSIIQQLIGGWVPPKIDLFSFFFHVNHTLNFGYPPKNLIFRVPFHTTLQPNQLKSKSKSILPLWYFCAKHFWLSGEDKTQRNFSLQLKKKHLEPFTHTKLILWIFQDFLFCFVFWPGNFPKSKIKRGKVGFSSSWLGFFQDLSAGFPPVLPSPRG